METVKVQNKGLKQAGPNYFNIKEYARSRLLHDMVSIVRQRATSSPGYIILVLDDYAARLLSSFCDVFDLMEQGSIYQIERLHLLRKRYPMSDVLYFVKPTLESIKKIIVDFPLDDELDYDQYGDVHLCFSNPVPMDYIELLNKQEKLVRKVKSFYEVNIDFEVWQDNIYKISSQSRKLLQLISPGKKSTLVERISEQLFTLCSVMYERPYVQYQGNSVISEQIATLVYSKLEYLFNYNLQQESQLAHREPRGTLLILDRTFDLITPFVHDYNYQSSVYDYLDLPSDGSLSKVLPPQMSTTQRQAASDQEHKLDERDPIWQKYKQMHIAEVLGMIGEDVKKLQQEQAGLQKLSKKQELHHDDIQNILKTLPEFEQKKTKLLIHLDLAQRVQEAMMAEDMNVMQLIELEQTIISGVNEDGAPISEHTITKNLNKMVKTLGRPEDRMRLLAIYICCYNLPKQDFKTVLGLLPQADQQEALRTLRDQLGFPTIQKIERVQPLISNTDLSEYKRKYHQELEEAYDILRAQPEIIKLAQEAQTRSLPINTYPYIGEEPDQKTSRKPNWHQKAEEGEEGRLIMFVIGGVTHYEIGSVQNLEHSQGMQNIVLGSNQIMNSRDFIMNLTTKEQVKATNKKQNQIIEVDDIELSENHALRGSEVV